MPLPQPSRRPPRAARSLLPLCALLTASAAPRADEVVTTDFDLAGWSVLQVARVETDIDVGADLAALMDRSSRTGLRTHVDGPVLMTVDLTPPQAVNYVGLLPADRASYAVALTLVRADGSRFGLGEKVVSEGEEALFQPIDADLSRIELEIECLEDEQIVHLAELRVGGRQVINQLSLEGVPDRLPEGGRFPIRVLGRDLLGGRPDVTKLAELVVTPQRALGRDDGGVVARVAGPITLAPRLRSLEGTARSVMVIAKGDAPPQPTAYGGFEVVEIAIEDPDHQHYEIFRRESGNKQPHSVGLTWGHRYLDRSIEPGKAYHYSVRAVDRFGNPLTHISTERRHRTLSRPGRSQVDIGRLPVLVLLYVDSLDGPGGEVDAIRAGLLAARSFVFRHTAGRLVLDLTFIELDGPTPDTAGPSMGAISAQLESMAVPEHFGVVYVVANDLVGAHGNFPIMDRMVGAMGRGPGAPTPPQALGHSLGADSDVAWVFLHELQHLIAARIAPSVGVGDLPSGDLAQDFEYGLLGSAAGRPFDAGEAWDAQAALLRDTTWWDDVQAPFRLPLQVDDSDGDGLADKDGRLPFDELRFGSDAYARDTDGDSVTDAEELRSGLYRPGKPAHPDSDGDGVPDGADPWPLADFTGRIPYGSRPQVIARGPTPWDPGPAPWTAEDRETTSRYALAACWTPEQLILEVHTDRPLDVALHIDGSGELGRWETRVGVGTGKAPGSDVWVGAAAIVLRHEIAPRGVFMGGVRVPGSSLFPMPHPDGLEGGRALRAVLPAQLGPGARDVLIPVGAPRVEGLQLSAGTVLGLAVTLREPSEEAPFDPFAGAWESLLEAHRLYDAVLMPPPIDDG